MRQLSLVCKGSNLLPAEKFGRLYNTTSSWEKEGWNPLESIKKQKSVRCRLRKTNTGLFCKVLDNSISYLFECLLEQWLRLIKWIFVFAKWLFFKVKNQLELLRKVVKWDFLTNVQPQYNGHDLNCDFLCMFQLWIARWRGYFLFHAYLKPYSRCSISLSS